MNKFKAIIRELGEIDKKVNVVEKMEFNLIDLKASEIEVIQKLAESLKNENVYFTFADKRLTVTFGLVASMQNRLVNSLCNRSEVVSREGITKSAKILGF